MRFFCSLFFSLWMSVVLGLSVEKTVCPSSTELLLLPCEQSSGHVVWACFWAFRCVPLACVAPFLPGSLHADGSSCIEDGTAKRVLPPMFQDCLSYSRICAFPIILEEAFLCLFKKKLAVILIAFALNHVSVRGELTCLLYWVFQLMNMLCPHLFTLSLIVFISVLHLSTDMPCTCFVTFILKHFIFFRAVVGDTVLVFSVSTCSLLVYRVGLILCLNCVFRGPC